MIYIMSDIHGQKKLFFDILKQIKFSENDVLYILGDVIDRGPDGIDLLQYIMKQDNIKMLLGNHEYMMRQTINAVGYFEKIDAIDLWYRNGGKVTFNKFAALEEEERTEIMQYIENLPVNIELSVNGKDYLLVHASPLPKYYTEPIFHWYENDTEYSVWNRNISLRNIDKTIIFGHTATYHFQAYKLQRIYKKELLIGVDCGCSGIPYGNEHGGRLGCLRLDDMKTFYSKV